jgi:hypothetical protein
VFPIGTSFISSNTWFDSTAVRLTKRRADRVKWCVATLSHRSLLCPSLTALGQGPSSRSTDATGRSWSGNRTFRFQSEMVMAVWIHRCRAVRTPRLFSASALLASGDARSTDVAGPMDASSPARYGAKLAPPCSAHGLSPDHHQEWILIF